MDLIDDSEWRMQVFMLGMSRCHDFKNLDMVKQKIKTPEESKELHKRIGIINLFNPNRPNG